MKESIKLGIGCYWTQAQPPEDGTTYQNLLDEWEDEHPELPVDAYPQAIGRRRRRKRARND